MTGTLQGEEYEWYIQHKYMQHTTFQTGEIALNQEFVSAGICYVYVIHGSTAEMRDVF